MNWLRLSLITIFSIPGVVFAQTDFVPLIGIPGLSPAGYNINTYIDILYVLTISVAAFLVVVRLIWAGFQYMLTDLVTSKEKAKTDIRNALVGLLIILSAVLILNTINPQLTDLEALNIRPVSVAVNNPFGEGVPALERPVTENDSGIDQVDMSDMTEEELTELEENCTNNPDGTSGQFIRRGDGTGYCLGNETEAASTNILNRPESLDAYIAENSLTTEEAAQLRQQYNQFVATQEPDGLTEELIAEIRTFYGAEQVLFVTRAIQPASAEALEGYADNQEAICRRLTGSDNIVEDRSNGYVACLR